MIIVGHLFIVFGIWLSYQQSLFSIENLKDFINVYFLLLPLIILGLFFRKLRNFNFYIIWVIIGIAQILVYPEVNDLNEFQFYRGSSFSALISLLPTLIIFQILRIIFIRTHNMEMIISIRYYRMTMWEEEENRKMTWLEVAFSMLLFFTIVFSNIYV